MSIGSKMMETRGLIDITADFCLFLCVCGEHEDAYLLTHAVRLEGEKKLSS